MKILFISVLIFFNIISINAAQFNKNIIELSSSSKVIFNKDLSIKTNFLPSYSSFSLEGVLKGKKINGWLSHKLPDVMANKASVDRVWSENLKNANQVGEISSTDFGCKETKNFLFRCERVAELKKGEFAHDVLYWNKKKDLIFLRVSSNDNKEFTDEAFKKINVEVGDK